MPPEFRPMLASTGAVEGGGWAFEPKLDGWRALVTVDGAVRVRSRRGRDLTASVPELAPLGPALGAAAVLDGELVAHDGRPESFYRLSGRMAAAGARSAVVAATRQPVTFMAFDLLWLDGVDLTPLPYLERRRRLAGLGVCGPAWATVPSFSLGAAEVGAACIELGLEGMVAKRTDARYRPGVRSSAWVKLKTTGWRERHGPQRHGAASGAGSG